MTQNIDKESTDSLDRLARLHAFELQYRETLLLPEHNGRAASAIALRHSSGAQLSIVACDSRESAFSYCFGTPPDNDKGLAHIVEHSVFCGSRNYPLKEPFANLQKTSVCSFLNAMTYPDQTLYPGASAFAPDFLQLLKVYGDAVFFPLLEEQALAQEGIRQTPDGPDGIVFNEMQGYYGDFESYVADYSLRSLFSNTPPHAHPNSYDAGGDPHAIASIDCRDYREIREFHRRHYRPENCRITMYGSIPRQHLAEILAYLAEELLGPAAAEGRQTGGPKPTNPEQKTPPQEPPLPQKQKLYQPIPVLQPGEKQRSIMFSWVLPPQHNPRQSLDYRLLAELLLGHPGAVLELPVMQSGWGADLCPGSGLESDLANPILRLGLSAYQPPISPAPEEGDCFRQLIFSTLEDFCRRAEQSPPEKELGLLWQGALNSLEYEEYSLEEHGGDDGIYALERCLQMAKAGHFYSGGPAAVFDSLQIFADIEALRAEGLAVFARKVRKYTLENPHWTLQLFEEVAAQENKGLSAIEVPDRLRLSPEQLHSRQQAFIQYQARRDEPEQIAKITAMNRAEFGELTRLPDCRREIQSLLPTDGSSIKAFKANETNEDKADSSHEIEFFYSETDREYSLIRLDLCWEISTWSKEQTVLLPLFLDLMEDLGLPGISYGEIAKQKSVSIGLWESDINLRPVFSPNQRPGEPPLRSFVYIRLSFLPGEWRKGLALFWQLLAGCNWEEDDPEQGRETGTEQEEDGAKNLKNPKNFGYGRLLELLHSRYYEKSQDLCSGPLGYAERRSRYRLSHTAPLPESSKQQARQAEWLYGLGQAELLDRLCRKDKKHLPHSLPQLAHSFRYLQKLLLHKAPLSCALTASPKTLTDLKRETAKQFLQARRQTVNTTAADFSPWADMVAAVSDIDEPAKHRRAYPRINPDLKTNSGIELWHGSIALENLCIALPAPPWSYGTWVPVTSPQLNQAPSSEEETEKRDRTVLHPAMVLLVKLLQSGPAWEKIRLQQGAYGVRVWLQNGFFLLCSSQDPHARNSVDLFYQAVKEIQAKAQAQAQNPDSEFLEEFEAALVQTLAEKLKEPLPGEYAGIALHQAKTGLQHSDLLAWLKCLRQLQIADLCRAAEYILELWPQKAVCIFAASGRISESEAAPELPLESNHLPRYG
ncbi:insulinase family protein [Candidatus Haliotispira prima]|uniref:Insulinase family protein n=1 Tax=Candidatus Haliotispira prima TaxID=3034016 RepID=A0ABY8MLM1_9SPIO|nr:insulinase family protein [Candidatus Haliotispira prima]